MIRIWIWIINVRLLGQCSRSGGIVASLIAAIPHCQTQPIELVYFALAESTSTQRSPRQGRKKNLLAQMEITWKTLTKTFICYYLPYMCHMRIFFRQYPSGSTKTDATTEQIRILCTLSEKGKIFLEFFNFWRLKN